MGNPASEQELFKDLPSTELSEQQPIGDDITDWSDFELLEDLIGPEAAWKIAEAFAGSALYIPKSILTNKSHHDIRRKFKAGTTFRELSIEYGYTEAHIRNIVHKGKKVNNEKT